MHAVVVINHQANPRFEQLEGATERERLTDEIGAPLSQRSVEAFNVIGLTRFLGHGTVPRGREHTSIAFIFIGVDDRALTIVSWQGVPQAATGVGRAISNRIADDASRLPLVRQPHPHVIVFRPNE